MFSPIPVILEASHAIIDTNTNEYLPCMKIFVYVELTLLQYVAFVVTNRCFSGSHRTKSHVSVFLKRGGNMQLHVSVMFNMHKKWSGSVVYAATETRENVTKPFTETQVIRRVSRTV